MSTLQPEPPRMSEEIPEASCEPNKGPIYDSAGKKWNEDFTTRWAMNDGPTGDLNDRREALARFREEQMRLEMYSDVGQDVMSLRQQVGRYFQEHGLLLLNTQNNLNSVEQDTPQDYYEVVELSEALDYFAEALSKFSAEKSTAAKNLTLLKAFDAYLDKVIRYFDNHYDQVPLTRMMNQEPVQKAKRMFNAMCITPLEAIEKKLLELGDEI